MTRQQLNRFMENLALHIGNNLMNELVRVAPVDTGNLKANITARADGTNIVIYMPDYAKYVEYGTPPHIIRPVNAKSLHWKKDGKHFFAQEVQHPGTMPQPFIRTTVRDKMQSIVNSAIRSSL